MFNSLMFFFNVDVHFDPHLFHLRSAMIWRVQSNFPGKSGTECGGCAAGEVCSVDDSGFGMSLGDFVQKPDVMDALRKVDGAGMKQSISSIPQTPSYGLW